LKLSCRISQLHVVPIIGWVTIIGSVTLLQVWLPLIIGVTSYGAIYFFQLTLDLELHKVWQRLCTVVCTKIFCSPRQQLR